jgi:hypothetical protein
LIQRSNSTTDLYRCRPGAAEPQPKGIEQI